jgi:hypothetical protein
MTGFAVSTPACIKHYHLLVKRRGGALIYFMTTAIGATR